METEEHFDEIIPLIITFLLNSNDNYYQIAQCLISFASDFFPS
ncbi:hypothetical protein XBP1_650037 [Xenorhabdus bovienii str. puntauvense]|uniref:Uncharacterized protein n=4 Tax=Xenorhabdus bovienii TaxID=40576 RepID=A0A0B6X7V9_XENBV|nr:hypothetical protein XBFFR1_1490022 [Xenorhabdus bovienii str. feltiae France]CDG92849.1 hypothetical protein XBFFL1_2360022 [Xenorhabdus bovienii str. feltiae Florida]CDG98955.1 hypothetical protein XBP1_650037 [Xenorhabdus bovienii str. puntauvense]CDH02375.1 hypothetical protein XBFM1_2600090 [Xenorhabdus bovienii str. feltiae Moldova]CDH25756.1 hypothetical protein XBKB1_4190026 [Xenorhabdus bovienii str. kraussei Becker Underwood]CDM88394.1 conserved protein of unknown function [Xenorh